MTLPIPIVFKSIPPGKRDVSFEPTNVTTLDEEAFPILSNYKDLFSFQVPLGRSD